MSKGQRARNIRTPTVQPLICAMLTDQEIEVRDAAAYALGFCPGGTQNEQADQTLCVRGELLSGFVRFVRLLGLICSPFDPSLPSLPLHSRRVGRDQRAFASCARGPK